MSDSTAIEIPDDLRRGLLIAASAAGKSPSRIVIEALEMAGVERLTAVDLDKRMTGSQ